MPPRDSAGSAGCTPSPKPAVKDARGSPYFGARAGDGSGVDGLAGDAGTKSPPPMAARESARWAHDDASVASPGGGQGGSKAEDYAMQKVQITSFIRHILEQYRFGLQILAEFIQNADDAQASEIDIGPF